MATNSKTPKNVVYPVTLNVCSAMGAKRKTPVIRAFNYADDEDWSKVPVYPTLRNAYKAGKDLIKHAADTKWLKIDKPAVTAVEDPELEDAVAAEAAEFDAATEAANDAAMQDAMADQTVIAEEDE